MSNDETEEKKSITHKDLKQKIANKIKGIKIKNKLERERKNKFLIGGLN